MRIRVLPDGLVARIAAGEVVERPASVVRELVENALDAGGRRISVEVEAGGKKRIGVTDDGHGMGPEDAAAAFQRHATSKIRSFEDLEELTTLGFRGEALPSIAAVSRVRMRTCPDSHGAGTRLRVEGGKVSEAAAAAGPRGTVVEVEDLFAGLPVRRRFLRSIPTELAHITDLMNRFALAHPEIDFRLRADGRPILEAPPAAGPGDRIRQVFGADFLASLVPVQGRDGEYCLQGFVSRPDRHFSARNRQILFINRRPIRDRNLAHAVQEAFRRALPAGRFPAALILLEVPASQVDVNVHPAKAEVRFREPGRVHDLLLGAIRTALTERRPFAPLMGEQGPVLATEGRDAGAGVREAANPWFRLAERAADLQAPLPAPRPAGAEAEAGALQAEFPPPPVRALGQYRDSFIIGVDREGLLVVDQHAAHERVLYERYVAGLGQEEAERQRLLFPRPLDLSATQMVGLEAAGEELWALGYRIEPFGPRGVLVREVPGVVDLESIESLLADLLTEAGRSFGRGEAGSLRERLAVTTACHAAVKIHQPLGRERMDFLLQELFRTSQPLTCPHGRPAALRIAHEELLSRFRRR